MKPFLYERLYASLLLELAGGHYRPDEKFLSLREMMARFGTSKITANAVQKRLLDEGFLYTRPRSGTYVATGAREQAMLALAANEPRDCMMPRTWQHKRERLRAAAGAKRSRHVMVLYSIPHSGEMFPTQKWQYPPTRASRGCIEAARERHAEVTLIFHDGSESRQKQVLEWMTTAELGGAVIAQRTATFGHFLEIVNPLLAKGVPVVHLFGSPNGADLACADFNNVAGGFQAGQRALEAGHRELTVLYWGNPVLGSTVLRIEGIRLAAQRYGATVKEFAVDRTNPFDDMPPLFRERGDREAIICLSFEFAEEVLKQACGKKEPGTDFSLIAFSSVAEVAGQRKIDIIRMDFDLLGATAMNLLLDTMEGKETHRTVLIPMPDEVHGTVCSQLTSSAP